MMRILCLLGLMCLAGACLGAEALPGAAQLGCTNCHALESRLVGPSWMEISRRYRAEQNDPALLEQLVRNVSSGSRGAWGSLPMPANDPKGAKREQIAELVRHILALAGAPSGKGK